MNGSKGGEIPHLAPALPPVFLPLSQPESPPFLYRWALLCCVKKGYCRATREGVELKFSVHHYHQSFPFKMSPFRLSEGRAQLFARSSLIRCRLEKYDPSLVPSDRRRSDDRSGVRGILGRKKAAPLTRRKVGRQKAPRSHDQPLF